MNVAIRADASSRIGSGHVMRCKTLADELHRRGANVRFVCREHPGHLIALLSDEGYDVATLPAVDVAELEDADATASALDRFAADWVVVDHYGLGEPWEGRIRDHAGQILAIDDLASRRHSCDALVDQNWFGAATGARYDSVVPSHCRLLLGPRYALLHPLFAELRRSLPPRDGIMRRLLVFFGAVDSCNQTALVLSALQSPAFGDVAVDVVIGAANPHAADIDAMVRRRGGTAAHTYLPNLAGLMTRADVMAGAGGVTTWERCCLGLPAVVTVTADNQEGLTVAVAELGAQRSLGRADKLTVEDWTAALSDCLGAPEQLLAYSTAARGVTDGLGVHRVAAMLDEPLREVVVRRALAADERIVLDWANDADVRQNAFVHEPITSDTHHVWFQRTLNDPDCLLLIGRDRWGLPVGQVRFDLRSDDATVDVSVDRAVRGRGAGTAVMRAALAALRTRGRCVRVVAEVLEDNHASLHMFRRLGFTAVAPQREGAHRLVLPL